MNPCERVMLALDHKGPDRIPIDLGATTVSSIAKTSYISLKQPLRFPLEEIKMKDGVAALAKADSPEKVRVIVGGAPLTETFAKSIGADGFAPDASRAVSIVKTLLGNQGYI